MGIGFVLLIWMVFFGCAGVPIAGGLAYWSWRTGAVAGTPSKTRAIAAALLPGVLIIAGLTWFFSYAFYSGVVRHVDAGIGDAGAVPLKHGYFFCIIDVPEAGYLMKDGCTGLPPVNDIRELAEVGNIVVGVSGELGAFTFDTTSHQVQRHESRAAALRQFEVPPQLQSAGAFYRSRRFGWQDVIAVVVLAGLVAGISWAWFRWFIQAPAGQRRRTRG